MTLTSHIDLQFKIEKEFKIGHNVYHFENANNLINRPIMIENIVMGIITEAELDKNGLFFNCKGILWNKSIGGEFILNEDKSLLLSALAIGDMYGDS